MICKRRGGVTLARALLFDGYVDEPACFGVPPYISPYVRYVFGAFAEEGWEVEYITCDQWRKQPRTDLWRSADAVCVISGMTVPGRYRGGVPLSLDMLRKLTALPREGVLFLGGPIKAGYALRGGENARLLQELSVDCICMGDPEATIAHFARTGEIDPSLTRSYENLFPWACAGAALLPRHPSYPWVMVEMELSRGCDRCDGRCSFCTEGSGISYEERPLEHVIEEARALNRWGAKAFRFGRCANILAYGGSFTASGGRRPSPEILQTLYREFRQVCPGLEILHTDNANPASIVSFPDAAAEAIAAIAANNTEGDVLSLGLESLSERVRGANNLKVDEEGALLAVRIVNEAGGYRKRPRGLPALLPGLNFLVGLAEERDEDLEPNQRFLRRLLDSAYAVRRINIRKAMVFPGTNLSELLRHSPSRIHERAFRRWKEWVRTEVDPLMLMRVAPQGTILRNVRIEERLGHVGFGRSLGSYPLLVGIVCDEVKPDDVLDVAVCDWGGRSLTAVPYPLDIERCSRSSLSALPGLGKARVSRILEARPVGAIRNLTMLLDDPRVAEALFPYFLEK